MTAPSEMLSVSQARAAILARFAPLEAETVSLLDALGRVLSEDVESDIDLPSFYNSSMDGYALRAADLAGARPDRPARLRVIADIPAGHPGDAVIQAGTAARTTP